MRRPSTSSSTPQRGKGKTSAKKRPYSQKSSGSRRSNENDNATPKEKAKFKSSSKSQNRFSEKENRKSGKPASGRFDKSQIKRKKSTFSDTTDQSQPEKIRLNKYIANSGVCSRREADELITMGLISVNGKVVTELGFKVNPGDEVRHETKILRAEKPVYILMNKPKGYLTTTKDPQERNTVMQLLGKTVKERVYPVGRLDRNTTGLLFLTNDGDLAEKLSHPSYKVKKIYKVELDKPLTEDAFHKLLEGVKLEEGRAQIDDLAVISTDRKTIGIELHIGWNRVVRRIFEALGYGVVKLDRTLYAGLDKKDLPRGHWRFLRKDEVVKLKHFK